MAKTNDDLVFEFLSDKPLSAGDELSFGHEGLSVALVKMVSGCKGSLTIGLFGGWGTGKSTIANNVVETLKDRGLPVVLFDVWKHETDTLRAAFFKESHNQLRAADALKRTYKKPINLEGDVAESVDQGDTLLQRFLKYLLYALVLMVVAAVIFVPIVLYLGEGAWLKGHSSLIITTCTILAAFGAAIGAFIKVASDSLQAFRAAPSYRFRDRMKDPHDFEKEFSKLLEAVKKDQILFVFDNLDRVTHTTSIDMLSMIKTFLEPNINTKNVAFLIPCDDGAIREHVEHVYLNGKPTEDKGGESSFRSEEFLRKFFNAVVWIPEFIPSELASYARNCLCATRVTLFDDEDLAWLIAGSFRKNPRQIKQFINTYLANFILATAREKTGDLPEGFCKENVRELCLYCLLNTKYPTVFEELRKAKVISLEETSDRNSNLEGHDAFWKTVDHAYRVVPRILNLRPFYSLRLSESEKKLPGITELLSALADGDLAAAKDRAEEIPDLRKKQSEFNEVFRDELDRTVNRIVASNLISGAADMVSHIGFTLDPTSVAQIQNSILSVVRPSIELLSPSKLLKAGVLNEVNFADQMVDDWINRINDLLGNLQRKPEALSSHATEVFLVIAGRPELGTGTRDVQNKLLKKHLLGDLDLIERLLEVPELSPTLVNVSLADKYMEQLQDSVLPDNAEARLRYYWIVNQFGADKIGSSAFDQAIQAYDSLLTWLLEDAPDETGIEVWVNAFDLLLEFLNMCSEKVKQEKHTLVLASLSVAVIHAIDSTPEAISEALAIPTLIVLAEQLAEPEQEQVATRVDSFFSECKGDHLESVLKKVADPKSLIENSRYRNSIEENATGDEQVFDIVYEQGGEEYRAKILRELIDDDADAALIRLSKPDFSTPPLFDVTDYALDAAASEAGSDKRPFLEIAAHRKCDGDDAKLRKYADQLKELLKSEDESSQEAGFDLLRVSDFLPGHLRFDVSKEVLDWLKSSGLTEKGQCHALLAVVLGVDQFNVAEKDDLALFCWDELIRRSSVPGSLGLGFDALKVLEVKHDKVWANNFESVFQRIEKEEAGSELGKNLLDGLDKLKPDGRLSSDEMKFWKKVQVLHKQESEDT